MTRYTGDTYTPAYSQEQIEQDIAEFDKTLRFPGFQQTLHSLAADMGHLASAFADTGNKGMRDRMDYFHKEISYLIRRIKAMETHIFNKHFEDKSEAAAQIERDIAEDKGFKDQAPKGQDNSVAVRVNKKGDGFVPKNGSWSKNRRNDAIIAKVIELMDSRGLGRSVALTEVLGDDYTKAHYDYLYVKMDRVLRERRKASNKMLTTLLDSATTIIPIREKEY